MKGEGGRETDWMRKALLIRLGGRMSMFRCKLIIYGLGEEKHTIP